MANTRRVTSAVTHATNHKPKAFGEITNRLAAHKENAAKPQARQLASIQEQIDAIARGDFAGALRDAAEDIELEIFAPPEFPFICRARGVADVLKAIEHNFAAVEDQRPTVSNVLVQGDLVVIFGTEDGTICQTRAPYRVEFVHRFHFVDGAMQNIQIIAARRT
jgi:ketosteroid isomerase-like protein